MCNSFDSGNYIIIVRILFSFQFSTIKRRSQRIYGNSKNKIPPAGQNQSGEISCIFQCFIKNLYITLCVNLMIPPLLHSAKQVLSQYRFL